MLPAFLPRVGYLNAQAEGPLYSAGQPAQQGSEDYLMPLKHLERFSYNLPSFSVSYHIKEISNKKKYSVSKVASCYPLKGYQGGGGSAICSSVVSDNSSLETVYKKAKGSVHSWPPW